MTSRLLTFSGASLVALAGAASAGSHGGSICDGGWSRTDVDGNGYVSPIEMNAYAEAQAKDMDADQSGSVSREEFVNCSKQALAMPAMERKGNLVDAGALDSDGNAKISASEYHAALTDRAEKAKAGDEAAAEEARKLVYKLPDESKLEFDTVPLSELVDRSTRVFMRLDADGSGDLTAEEYEVPVMKPIDIDDVLNREFDAADSDQSGDLTQTELIAANERRANRAMERAEQASGEAANPEVGAPVVYYTYPSTM